MDERKYLRLVGGCGWSVFVFVFRNFSTIQIQKMGNSNKKSVENGDDPKLKGTTAIAVLKPVGKSKKLLCLHGWRTSGEILLRQTTALRYHTEIEVVVIDAPTVAKGPPAEGIAEFYSEYSYFEWYDGLREGVPVDMNTVNSSLEFLKLHLEKYGPYDGILGFSQGGSVATMLAQMQQKLDVNWFKFIVLIGAVQPPENCFDKEVNFVFY